MMPMLIVILMVFGFGCLLLAALYNPQPPARIHFGWLGLAFWSLAEILTRLVH